MTTQYQVPLHLCQWCYKNTGRFIIDCLCLVCELCLNAKKNWVDQNGRCFNCDKITARRFIDLKNNPQQGGFYFQNINQSARNFLKIQEFQQEVAKKYCKHLQSRVKKFETIIKQFVHQFPKYGPFFEHAFHQMEQKENKNGRSKSAEMQIQKYEKKEKAYQKKEIDYNGTGSKTSYASIESISGRNYQNPQKIYASGPNYDSIPKSNIRKEPSKLMINPARRENFPNQVYAQNNGNQIYVIGGSRKVSDPRRQQQPIKLNNAVNIQTAIRSIRSEDEKGFPSIQSNQKPRQITNHQHHPPNNMFRMQQGLNLQESNVSQDGPSFQFFGRRSK